MTSSFVARMQPEASALSVSIAFVIIVVLAMIAADLASRGVARGSLTFGAVLLVAFFLLILSPGYLGRGEAMQDRSNLSRLPRVEITLREEDAMNRADLSGTWRVVRQNDGTLWVAREVAGELEVTQVDLDLVLRINYLESK